MNFRAQVKYIVWISYIVQLNIDLVFPHWHELIAHLGVRNGIKILLIGLMSVSVAVFRTLLVIILHHYLGSGPLLLFIYLCGSGPTSLQTVQEHRQPTNSWPDHTCYRSHRALCHLQQPWPRAGGRASCACSLKWSRRELACWTCGVSLQVVPTDVYSSADSTQPAEQGCLVSPVTSSFR